MMSFFGMFDQHPSFQTFKNEEYISQDKS